LGTKITIGLFEVTKIIRQVLARNLIDILDAYGLRNKIITYVKDKGSNLNSLTNPLKFVVKCETLGLEESFKELVLVMLSLEHANMPQLMTKFVRT
jgi:hypothetical protein